MRKASNISLNSINSCDIVNESPRSSAQSDASKRSQRQSSVRSSVKFHFSDNEDDQKSLERIHTFNLKSEMQEDSIGSKKLQKKSSLR